MMCENTVQIGFCADLMLKGKERNSAAGFARFDEKEVQAAAHVSKQNLATAY
jgi:hypothetical protein